MTAWRDVPFAAIVAGVALLASAALAATATDEYSDPTSSTSINKALTNPVSTTWSLKIKNTVQFLDRIGQSDRGEYKLEFQPTMPVIVTPQWKVITRPEFTLLEDKPYDSDGMSLRTTGVGDTVLDLVLAPMWDGWLVGVGPTFIFPTANLDETGQGKWQAGPAAVAGYESRRWLLALLLQQWWSFAGASDRSDTSEMHLQYEASWFFTKGWSIGTSPTIKFDWKASSGNKTTFPLGLSLAKVFKPWPSFPVKVQIQGLYAPVRPDSYGEKFGIELYVTPVIPSLIEGPLY